MVKIHMHELCTDAIYIANFLQLTWAYEYRNTVITICSNSNRRLIFVNAKSEETYWYQIGILNNLLYALDLPYDE